MNRKGFTLLELLSVITIFAIIGSMVSFNIINLFNEQEKSKQAQEYDIIKDATSTYLHLKDNKEILNNCEVNTCIINTNTLVINGILKEENISRNYNIKVYKENNELKYIIN